MCSKHTRPNAFGACIVVPSRLNIPAWQAGLTNYHDSEVALFLAHGWPVNYCLSCDRTPFDSNHSSAVHFAVTTWCRHYLPYLITTRTITLVPILFGSNRLSFIETELSHEAAAGPFKHDPIPSRLQTSPLQTVDKDKTKRRVVLDLSFPPG